MFSVRVRVSLGVWFASLEMTADMRGRTSKLRPGTPLTVPSLGRFESADTKQFVFIRTFCIR